MIGLPFNDQQCLGAVSDAIIKRIDERDGVLVELASRFTDTAALAEWIRSLPQRDDIGDKHDGPKVGACSPAQRLRIPADDPNCFERAALYCAVAELIDPAPVRQLATLDTPVGLHTFPVENGAPVVLDPRVPRNCLDGGVALLAAQPIEVDVRDAIEWTAQLAEAGAAPYRNGPSRVRRARNAVKRLVEEGAAPDEDDADVMGWMLALAENVAERMGNRALEIVRTTALAIADLASNANTRNRRNVALEIGGLRLTPAPWLSGIARIAGRIGADVGAVAVRTKLASLGVGNDLIGLVEQELNREGFTLGALARPPRLPTIADFAKKRL